MQTKQSLIQTILEESRIHHNATTHGLDLPKDPINMPEEVGSDLFWQACNMVVDGLIDDWVYQDINDTGNRNLCDCKYKLSNGACRKHDLWAIYQTGRMGATLYWTKYWDETNTRGVYFLHDEEDLEQMTVQELKTMLTEIRQFNKAVQDARATLGACLEDLHNDWIANKEQEDRKRALGYYKTLEELLQHRNPQVVRLAKGIKKQLSK